MIGFGFGRAWRPKLRLFGVSGPADRGRTCNPAACASEGNLNAAHRPAARKGGRAVSFIRPALTGPPTRSILLADGTRIVALPWQHPAQPWGLWLRPESRAPGLHLRDGPSGGEVFAEGRSDLIAAGHRCGQTPPDSSEMMGRAVSFLQKPADSDLAPVSRARYSLPICCGCGGLAGIAHRPVGSSRLPRLDRSRAARPSQEAGRCRLSNCSAIPNGCPVHAKGR